VGKTTQNAQGYVNDDLRADGLWKGRGFWVDTCNVDSLAGRAREVVEALSDKKVDVACIQETQWKGSGCTSVDIGDNAKLELVYKFCYLGDMLS